MPVVYTCTVEQYPSSVAVASLVYTEIFVGVKFSLHLRSIFHRKYGVVLT